MKPISLRLARGAAVLAAVLLASSCGLPRSGPNKNEIFAGSVMREGDAFVLLVDDRINRIASVTPALGFSESFRNAGQLGSDTISPGDTLSLTIWENVADGLLSAEGQNATVLDEVQVDGAGFIFVPYAGRIRAAGNTPEAIRRIITEKLDEQTPDPQVQVRRLAGDGATVSVAGVVGGQGVYPIERPTRTLSAMLAAAGGVTVPPEIAQVTLTRGDHTGQIWFDDLYDHPGHDIALRAGDRIFVEQDRRSFTALGATGTQSRVPFESQTISAIEAIAQVGGLNPALADPTGVFVFRNEPEPVARQLLDRDDLQGSQRVVYVLDLTGPNGMFMARDFAIRDDDTVYVTEAPFSQFNKTISALTGTLGQATGAANTLTGN
ncbi:polysaccharide biosynthesis/export family protein [Salibaculum halophilum]|uniref:polysaccharide biosynthesis/export family protein n=1 Tax=Salibaculum halophilum TaxID=1914408 RepID=UPI001FE2644E|nr:polysaccharide biosynthesis/export family protein [Salibaculum halophilum]